MEITLNLVPEVILRRREQAARRRLAIGAPLLIVLAVVALYVALNLQVTAARHAARAAEDQLAPLRPVGTYLAQLQEEIENLEERRQALESLTGRRTQLAPVLEDISTLIPQDVWLQSMTIESGAIQLSGYALQIRSVARFATTLNRSARIEQVRVEDLQQVLAGRQNVTQFVMRARLKGSAP